MHAGWSPPWLNGTGNLVAFLFLAALTLAHFQAGVALGNDVNIATALDHLAVRAALFHVAD